MYAEKDHHIHFYTSPHTELYATEFGHSRLAAPRQVGPYVRDEWIVHLVVRDVCCFCGMDVGPGEGFLIARGQVHTFTVQQGYEHYWIAFGGAGVSSLKALFALETGAHQHLHFGMDADRQRRMLQDAFEQADGPGGERAAVALLLGLLAHLTPPEGRNAGYVRSACAFMEHNYHRRITMEEVAACANVSEKYLCRLFKRELGLTPMQYLIGLRMRQARALLESTPLLVREVALTVGYSSQLAFSAAFSGYWGVSPTAARLAIASPMGYNEEDAP